jgi:hypothetical protein
VFPRNTRPGGANHRNGGAKLSALVSKKALQADDSSGIRVERIPRFVILNAEAISAGTIQIAAAISRLDSHKAKA